jgi:DNA-binding NarL/FixJ family response regulator
MVVQVIGSASNKAAPRMPHKGDVLNKIWPRVAPMICVVEIYSTMLKPYATIPNKIASTLWLCHKSALDIAITQKLMEQMFEKNSAPVYQEPTEREMDVLQLCARGYTNKAIAVQLSISDRTMQGHLAHIFDKLQAGSRTEAVMRAVSLGWISENIADTPGE